MPISASINHTEIAHFSNHAGEWWNPDGALRPLHKLNPTRLDYVRHAVCEHYGRAIGTRDVLKGLSVLDVGCGGGLLCEPLARLGATVTGLDASAPAIKTAQEHAGQSGLKIPYICDSIEHLAQDHKKYDVITALEILEHVAAIGSFLDSVATLLKPDGIVILSTVNRTAKSYILGIVAAEYILKWVPRGTHDWRKFIKPSELAAHLNKAGLNAHDITGVIFDPLNDTFHLRPGAVGVNYMMSAVKS